MPAIRRHFRTGLAALAILAVCSLAACSRARHAGFVSEQGYSLDPPAGWEVSTTGRPMLDVMARAPRENDFSANLNVTVTSIQAGADPRTALQQLQTLYPHLFQNFQMTSHRTMTVDGDPALEMTGTYSLPGTGQRLWLRQMVAFHKGKNYAFSCTALDGNHDKYAPAFEAALASVHWR